MTRRWMIAVIVISAVALAACGSGQSSGDQVLVSAAASLTDLFGDLEDAYEGSHPDVELIVNFGGSSALREQIVEGAPVDVFASADLANMEVIVDADLVAGEPEVFATNQMEIAVAPGNPGGVSELADLSEPALLIGLCAEEVPCGRLGRDVLANAGVTPAVDSNEPDVGALLTKLELGELDVGVVYATDVTRSVGAVGGIPIPAAFNVTTDYPIAVLSGSRDDSAPGDFVSWVLSDEGQKIVADHGFGLP